MATSVREIKHHPSGWWCLVENGRWFPISMVDAETVQEFSEKHPWDLWEDHWQAFESESDTGVVSKSDMNEDEYKDYLSAQDLAEEEALKDDTPPLSSLATAYYSQKTVDILKANTGKFINFFTYALPASGALTSEPNPVPPPEPKPLPVVQAPRGRKFRHEE